VVYWVTRVSSGEDNSEDILEIGESGIIGIASVLFVGIKDGDYDIKMAYGGLQGWMLARTWMATRLSERPVPAKALGHVFGLTSGALEL
jgi:hypothetical protein